MSNAPDPKGFSLRRWSMRKLAAGRSGPAPAADAVAVAAPRHDRAVDATAAGASPATVADPAAISAGAAERSPATAAARETLPALDTLTFDSDYTAFMQPGVDDTQKCGALKKLFSDPRFNVMDGLDVYVGDYSQPDPIDPAIVRTLTQARYIFNPPATRVNAEGWVEDVPDEPALEAVPAAAATLPPPADDVAQADEVPLAPPADPLPVDAAPNAERPARPDEPAGDRS